MTQKAKWTPLFTCCLPTLTSKLREHNYNSLPFLTLAIPVIQILDASSAKKLNGTRSCLSSSECRRIQQSGTVFSYYACVALLCANLLSKKQINKCFSRFLNENKYKYLLQLHRVLSEFYYRIFPVASSENRNVPSDAFLFEISQLLLPIAGET